MSAMHQTRAPRVFESRNNSGVGRAHTEPAVLRRGSEMRIPSRHLVAQHQHPVELGVCAPFKLGLGPQHVNGLCRRIHLECQL